MDYLPPLRVKNDKNASEQWRANFALLTQKFYIHVKQAISNLTIVLKFLSVGLKFEKRLAVCSKTL